MFSTAATQEMLKDYCHHRYFADMVMEIMNEFPAEWLKSQKGLDRFTELTNTLDKHTNRAAMLATKLRMTNQSRYMPREAHSAHANTLKSTKPWDWDPPIDA